MLPKHANSHPTSKSAPNSEFLPITPEWLGNTISSRFKIIKHSDGIYKKIILVPIRGVTIQPAKEISRWGTAFSHLFTVHLYNHQSQPYSKGVSVEFIAIVVTSSVPIGGGMEDSWMNGIYDSVCTIILFPILVYLGASGKTTDKGTSVICKFLGDISYPLYIVHYPFMYLYYAWLWSGEKLTFSDTWPVALVVFFGNILLAYLCLKLYDEPVRKWLTKEVSG